MIHIYFATVPVSLNELDPSYFKNYGHSIILHLFVAILNSY